MNLRDRLDPDGVQPRDDRMNEQRSLKFYPQPSGMLKLIGLFPPEDAASWLAIDTATQSPRTRPTFPTDTPDATYPNQHVDSSHSTDTSPLTDRAFPTDAATESSPTDPATLSSASPQGAAAPGTAADDIDAVFADARTPAQKRADVFTDLIRKAATLPDIPRLNGAAATISVHADLDDIVEGRGIGWIPGITEPLPASTIQQLLCHADTHTTVFGDSGRVLAHGKAQRLFTTPQVRAMAARDGGCVWPGCDRPPSWCESHHVLPWQSPDHAPGRTDLDNGALLCHFHHRIMHTADWQLTMIKGAPHFIPPATIDWQQTPRPATQQRTHTRLKPIQLTDLPARQEPWQSHTRHRA